MENKNEILKLLYELKSKGEVFNKMVGYLYSSICADEMTELIYKLEKYNVKVEYYQPYPGRVAFLNMDYLIEKYKN